MTHSRRHARIWLTAAFVVILAVAVALIVRSWPSVIAAAGLGATGLLLIVLVCWHARHTRYECPACGEVFRVTALTDFLSAHTPEKKLLRCPRCRVTDWCRVTDQGRPAGMDALR